MGRRSFAREFKLKGVRPVRERGMTLAQASLGLHPNVLRKWAKDAQESLER